MIWLLRRALGLGIAPGAMLARWVFGRRVRRYREQQALLSQRYALENVSVQSYAENISSIEAYAATQPDAQWATTSGTTGRPKRIPYSMARLRRFKLDSALAGLWCFHRNQVTRGDLYVLASRKKDQSFTALTMHSNSPQPHWVKALIYPSAHERDQRLEPLFEGYGNSAVRLWLMLLTDPGVLYCTNPSTLAVFLQDLTQNWQRTSSLLRDWLAHRLPDGEWSAVVKRLGTHRQQAELQQLASAEQAPAFRQLFPAAQAYCSWDGGYVGSYLQQIDEHMPADCCHIAMYSMSTETVQTLPFFAAGEVAYLPIVPGVRYEFQAVGGDVLIEAWALEPGSEYVMIVSDPYGLRRYNSEDVFLCKRMVLGLPDLRFLRRDGIRWSFTGEKLTAEQVQAAWQLLSGQEGVLHTQMTVIPDAPAGEKRPHYVLCLADAALQSRATELASKLDQQLQGLNEEYKSKRVSARLGPMRGLAMSYAELAVKLDRRTQSTEDVQLAAWESQFKLPPIWQRLWADL